jgi:hypothetical protein
VPEGEQTEYRILVGEWVSTREFAERLRQLRSEQGEPTDEREDD